MEEERINVVKNLPEPKSICDIQVFLGFANFYCRFIQSFSRIAAPLTSMLRMSIISTTQKSMNLVDEFGEGDRGKNEARRASMSTKGPTGADYPSFDHVSYTVSNNVSNYLTADAKSNFDQLRQAFTEAPILQYFDPEWYIWVETDASEYAIGGVLSQLTNDLSRWHPLAYFMRKMIPAKIWYKTYNGKLLAIVEAFKTWRHYLEGCKHKILILTNHNNLWQFMDTKSSSSRQVR